MYRFQGKDTDMSQTAAIDAQERARVMTMAVVRAGEKLGLSGKDMALILGVSEPTVSRMRKDEYRLEEGTKPFELGAKHCSGQAVRHLVPPGRQQCERKQQHRPGLRLPGEDRQHGKGEDAALFALDRPFHFILRIENTQSEAQPGLRG